MLSGAGGALVPMSFVHGHARHTGWVVAHRRAPHRAEHGQLPLPVLGAVPAPRPPPGAGGDQESWQVTIAYGPSDEFSDTTTPDGATIAQEIVPEARFCADT
jgi:hypothetical protein